MLGAALVFALAVIGGIYTVNADRLEKIYQQEDGTTPRWLRRYLAIIRWGWLDSPIRRRISYRIFSVICFLFAAFVVFLVVSQLFLQ